MAKCQATIDEIRFNLQDETVTHVYILVKATGDCPPNVGGWHHKTFPLSLPVTVIVANFISDYLHWEQLDPDMKKTKRVAR